MTEAPSDRLPPLGLNLNVLMVWPRFVPSFWGFEGMLDLIPEKAITPPLGLVTVAALCPATWQIRLIDHALEEIRDRDLEWADLVMVSAMYTQRSDTHAVLARARALGRRTFIGGPWASSQPELLLEQADHVLVGEAEAVFADIARDLEQGTARRLYRVSDKPDLTESPMPRFDLLRMDMYTAMPVQFSRGCPFECEFCDIITLYGRRPRTKTPAQLIAELDRLYQLGWRKEVHVVDDNFLGNYPKALALARELAVWQRQHGRPFSFATSASLDVADRHELIAAMVEANFIDLFIGIETPSADALKEAKKFQNLRRDAVQQVRKVQESGLWVSAGFIVGFDSDDETIFERQLEFIERTAIPWAMAGVLQALPTTPLYDRMKREGRLNEASQATSNFSPPNFRTRLPLPVLLRGLARLLSGLYEAEPFFKRALRSLEVWTPRATQQPPQLPWTYHVRVLLSSIWGQGIRSSYRRAYWRFLYRLVRSWARQPAKLWVGMNVLLSAQHFLVYSRQVAEEFERECRALEEAEPEGMLAATP